MTIQVCLALLILLQTVCQNQATKTDYEALLLKYLKNDISDYRPTLRPVLDAQQQIRISIMTMLSHIIAVNSARNSVRIYGHIYATWFEERLVWDPTNFGNISVIDWESDQMWFPVMFIYNGMGDNMYLKQQFPVFINSVSPDRSVVSATWRQEWEFSCQFDMRRFPLDRHICDMELYVNDQGRGLNTIVPENGYILHPTIRHNELAVYVENSEWRMLNLSTFVKYKKYKIIRGQEPLEMPTYVLRMEIERVSTYYMLNVVTPLLLLTLLQVLVFFVPVESGEKLGFGITIMLSYTVFLLLLDGILPKSQLMPAVASFITAAMALSTVSLLLTSVIIRFHFAPETSPMPMCLRCVFVSCLGRLLCIQRLGRNRRTRPEVDASDSDDKKSPDGGPMRSDWQVAAAALERLTVVLGCPAALVMVLMFIILPLH